MGRIIGYQYDDNVQDGDAWIGSEDGGGRTKQYTAEAVASYLNIQGKISIVGQMTYKYGVTPLSGPGTFAVFGGGTDPVAFSAITKLTLSNTDVSKQRVVEFLNLLVGSDILISKQGAISTFGYYSIDNYAVNATDPAYYDLGVTFKSGNGSMEAEQIYETQNFTLAAEENISTLQTTIDAGNTYQASTPGVLWTWNSATLVVDGSNAPEGYEGIFSGKYLRLRSTDFPNYTTLSNGSLVIPLPGAVNTKFRLSANPLIEAGEEIGILSPATSGTLALTTDITASPWDTVTGGINYANGNVGIGTATPSAKLDVNGDALINGLTVGQGAGTSAFGNTVFGKTALDSITTGLRNVAIGNEALLDNTIGNYNIALGYQALGSNVSGNNNIAIGWQALQRAQTVNRNTAVGYLALGLTSGANNTAIGYGAGYLRVGGTNGNSIDSVFIGSLTKSNGLNSENEIVIGTGAESAGSNTVVLGNDDIVSTRLKGDVIVANGNVGIGTTNPGESLDVAGSIRGETVFIRNIGGYNAKLLSSNLTFNRTFTFPDNEGTIALTSDIPAASQWDDVTGGINYASGNVGIGTTSPSTKLEVISAANEEGIAIKDSSGNLKYKIRQFGGNSYSTFWDSTNTEKVRITSGGSSFFNGGNVGIGTTAPQTLLHLESTAPKIKLSNSQASAGYYTTIEQNYSYTGPSFAINSVSGATARILLGRYNNNVSILPTGTGNVGIGTDSPTSKLEVAGGDIELSDVAGGITMISPDGTRYRITVANGGTLTVAAV